MQREIPSSGGLFLTGNGFPGLIALNDRVEKNLEMRLQSRSDLTASEIEKVAELDKSLFPGEFEISEEARESLRVLCSYSRCELRSGRDIRSHRRFVGPVIVFLKRLSWPLIRFHLKDTFESMQLFHSWVVYSHARQVVELEQLKHRLKNAR